MSSDTPTILKKILARKHEEIAERSALVSIAQLIEKAQSAESPRGFAAALEAKLTAGQSAVIAEIKRPLRVKGLSVKTLIQPPSPKAMSGVVQPVCPC